LILLTSLVHLVSLFFLRLVPVHPETAVLDIPKGTTTNTATTTTTTAASTSSSSSADSGNAGGAGGDVGSMGSPSNMDSPSTRSSSSSRSNSSSSSNMGRSHPNASAAQLAGLEIKSMMVSAQRRRKARPHPAAPADPAAPASPAGAIIMTSLIVAGLLYSLSNAIVRLALGSESWWPFVMAMVVPLMVTRMVLAHERGLRQQACDRADSRNVVRNWLWLSGGEGADGDKPTATSL
jgi:hypothetical protein